MNRRNRTARADVQRAREEENVHLLDEAEEQELARYDLACAILLFIIPGVAFIYVYISIYLDYNYKAGFF